MGEKPVNRVETIIKRETGGVISAFEKAVGMSNNSIQTAIKRNSNLKDDTLNNILNAYPQYSAIWLLTGKGEMLNPSAKVAPAGRVEESVKKYNVPQVITVDSHDRENITLVPVKARAGYLDGYYKPEYIRTLPTYRMPGLNNGTFRAFENKGQSMNLTLHDKSYAIGEWVEDWHRNIKDDRLYIIVSEDVDNNEEGVIIKRCLNRIKKYNNLICKSDNLDRRAYPNINLDPSTIKEVWEVKGAMIFQFPNPSNIFDRINDLEAEMSHIRRTLK